MVTRNAIVLLLFGFAMFFYEPPSAIEEPAPEAALLNVSVPDRSPFYNTVNGVLGDESFVSTFGRSPGQSDSEDLRLRTHLAYVETLLRAQSVDGLSYELRAARARNLDRLHAYWAAGVFPRNTIMRDRRTPVFIDGAGRICAVGYLFEQDEGRKAAERINQRFQTATIFEIDDAELAAWLATSGLTLKEAAMIQPAYGPYIVFEFEFETKGATACSSNENPTAVVESVDELTISDMMRMPALVCADGRDDVFESTGFLSEFDPIRSVRFEIEYEGTVERPLEFPLNFRVWSSASGPTEGRVLASADGGSSFVVFHEFPITQSPMQEFTVVGFFVNAPPGSDVLIAFEARGGEPGGSLYLDDVFGFGGYTPVELISFDATVIGSETMLRWVTASETNNAGFEVQMKAGDESDFSTLDFVEGHGTTTETRNYIYTVPGLDPGAHNFRLKQIDFDGAFEYSDEIEATISVPGTYLLTSAYPNPFNPQASFSLSVAQTQEVTVGVYDVLGRRVVELFNGVLEGGSTHPFELDGRGLPTGPFFIRAAGETFSASQSVTLVR